MKIEKISDNQIRCTLSREDLVDRELRISELAYGTEKAKALFREMMQQASYEFGFEADDIPLMIEAIPISTESLILVITKVDDPDELDTRFSKFSPDYEGDNAVSENDNDVYADEIINSFNQLNELLNVDETPEVEESTYSENTLLPVPKVPTPKKDTIDEPNSVTIQTNLTKVFSFTSLQNITKLSEHIVCFYHGINSVYKNSDSGKYYLVITKSEHTPEEFNKICNIISEYGNTERTTYASISYYQEHFEQIVKDNAIQILSVM
jgi:adapter protein MecA 1/2